MLRWDDGSRTWDGGGLRCCFDGDDAGVGSALLVLCHHVDLVLRVPGQAVQRHVLAQRRDADLWFPLRDVLLFKGKKKPELLVINHLNVFNY